MSLLDSKLDKILVNTNLLIDQNNHYKMLVHDLSERLQKLETENKMLNEKLLLSKNDENTVTFNKERLKEQIEKYLQDIDLSIQWLSDLE